MKKSGPVLAFDRASVRSYDADGRLHVAVTNISKANVCDYYGQEIPEYQELGLDPNKVYKLWRDPAELEKAAPSFRNMPLQLKHVHQKADDPQQDIIVGSVGDPVFASPYLTASLCVWHEAGIAAIESKSMVELSSAYRYQADMTPGETPDGEAYDGRMVNISGNHVALVEVGRAGPDVLVADADPFTPKQEIPAMKYTKLGLALKVALSAASPKIAQDSGLPALVGKASQKAFKKDDVVKALVAMDADIDVGQLEGIIEAIVGVAENPEPSEPTTAADEDDNGAKSKHSEIIDFLKSKGLDAADLEAVGNMLTRMDSPPAGMDEEEVNDLADKKVEAAMDSMRKEFRELETAKSAVRSVVGDVLGMDSADAVYGFALDHLKVDHDGMSGAALAKMFKLASASATAKPPVNKLATDAASVATIKGLDRFS